MEEEVLRDTVRVFRPEDCDGLEECIRTCFEDTVIEVKPEDLLKTGRLPRDCIVIVKTEG